MKKSKLLSWPTLFLIVFLPLSAWLVSYTGNYFVALGRDILLGLLIVVGLFNLDWRHLFTLKNLVFIAFVVWVLLSFFWRTESLSQWLRGVRYVAEPIVLFLLLANQNNQSLKLPWKALGWMTLITLILGLAEYIFPEVFRRSLTDSLERGVMSEVHYASEYHRLQGTLAGPNAMGLFIMLMLILWPIWRKSFPKVVGYTGLLAGLIALALTFSRSSFLGLVVGIVGLIVIYWPSLAKFKKWLIPLFVIGVAAGIYLTINPPSSLARPFSGDLRVQQAKRVYRERGEIGFFGRGVGSAGLVSQNRLDEGPNYYTENTYLDMYEGMGVIGALLYLGLWITTLVSLIRSKSPEIKIIGIAGLGLAIAGIFINHYTGQAALWYFWILAGLAVYTKDSNPLTDTV